jgi:hypothetical protein
MDRNPQLRRQWVGFVAGMLVGLLVVTPVLAVPPDLPLALDAAADQMLLLGSGLLLALALALKFASAHRKPKPYGQHFFPDDRDVTLEKS